MLFACKEHLLFSPAHAIHNWSPPPIILLIHLVQYLFSDCIIQACQNKYLAQASSIQPAYV